MLGSLLLAVSSPLGWCQQPVGQANAMVPPTIQETVPPLFDNYQPGPDSQRHSSVPEGKTFSFELSDSKIFPNTTRTITVYIPAAYQGDKPACLYVGLDSLSFDATVVLDNLISQHAMPVTIAVGVSPGKVASVNDAENPRFDRSLEFDSRNDRLARLLIEEVLPAVERHRTPDGLPIRLSENPDDRAIGGASTGGIGSFTVAWERPDSFHRVFIAIGTFVGMRGGESYYVAVRKTEPKPLRIFMEDGAHDEWNGGPEIGDWWMSNQTMNRALEFAGYDVQHIWGAGTHNSAHATSIFPEAMRWLWRDWPTAVVAGSSANPVLQAVLQKDSNWELAATGCSATTTLAADGQGKVFCVGGSKFVSAGAEVDALRREAAKEISAFAYAADGSLYEAQAQGGVRVTPPHGTSAVSLRAPGIVAKSLIVRSNGDIYLTTETHNGTNELWLLSANGKALCLDKGLKDAAGLALTPDGRWLFVAQASSRTGLSYRVKSNGTLDSREAFYNFDLPSFIDESRASQISMDKDGRAYVGTRVGVEVFDRNGRTTAILPVSTNEAVTGVCFGGPNFDTLFVVANGKVYRRKFKAFGYPPWAAPLKLAPGSSG